MKRIRLCWVTVFLFASLITPSLLLAGSDVDPVVLMLSRGSIAGQVNLQWTGAYPPYTVYRSSDAATLIRPDHKLGVTQSTSWVDAPPQASIAFYAVTGTTLLSIEVTPADPTLPAGYTLPFTATGTFSDGTSRDITSIVSWTSSAATIATVSNTGSLKGVVTGLAPGTSQICAGLDGMEGTTYVTVTNASLASIDVTPTNSSVPAGYTLQFTATGTFSDGSTLDVTSRAVWTSTMPAIASVSNAAGSKGLATALAPGNSQIGASSAGIAGSTTVTVTNATLASIEVAPPAASVPAGFTVHFTATGTFSDGSTRDLTDRTVWASAMPSIVSVSNGAGSKGVATGLAPGTTQISATYAGVAGSTTTTVTSASLLSIEVAPVGASLPAHFTVQFTVTGTFSDGSTRDISDGAVWTSSNPAFATVSNAAASKGVARGVAAGTTQIRATSGGIEGSAHVTVTDATPVSIEVAPHISRLPVGFTVRYTAIATFSDGATLDVSERATWSTSNTDAMKISNADGSRGLATAVAPGATQITASSGGVSGSTGAIVSSASLASIDVTPTNPGLPAGFDVQLTATATLSDGSTLDVTGKTTWTTNNPTIASVSNSASLRGVVTGVAPGTTQISATYGGVAGSTVLTISGATLGAIEVAPSHSNLPVGFSARFTAIGTFSDKSTKDITARTTWTTSNPAFATVSNAAASKGLVTPAAPGTTQITATYGAIAGSTVLTISGASFGSIEITPSSPAPLPRGRTRQFTATATLSDGLTLDVSERATWTTINPQFASVSNAASTKGVVTGVAPGMTQVRATYGGVLGSTVLTISGATLSSIEVAPVSVKLPIGIVPVRCTAIATFSDGSTLDVTGQVTWSSSNPAAVKISNADGLRGLATAVAAGNAQITASAGGISGSASVTVSGASLVSIEVTPTNPSLPAGFVQQFTATATLSDGSTLDVTERAVWTSTNAAVATVSNASGAKGVVSGLSMGTTQISADVGAAIGGSTTVTVTDGSLLSIEVAPPPDDAPSLSRLPVGFTTRYTAIATFSDGTSRDISDRATWTSSNPAFATVSNAAGLRGFVTSAHSTPDITQITATYGGVAGSAVLTISGASLVSIEVAQEDPSSSSKLPVGFTTRYPAIGTFSDGTSRVISDQVTWTSSNPAFATVSNAAASRGLVTPANPGTTQITATCGAIAGSTVLTISGASLASIEVAPEDPSFLSKLPVGFTTRYTAIGTFSDGTSRVISDKATWTSSNPAFATVSNAAGSRGLVTASASMSGTAQITATYGGVSGSTVLTISGASFVSIEVTPTNPSLPAGFDVHLTATATFSDGSTMDVTERAVWTSTNAAIATVSNASGAKGVVSGLSMGTTQISAHVGAAIGGSTTLSVTDGSLLSLEVAPPPDLPSSSSKLPVGFTVRYTAIATFSDGTSRVISDRATWSSSNPAFATVSGGALTRGLVTGVSPGTTQITATCGAIAGSTVLTISGASLATVEVTPTNPSVPVPRSQPFTVTGIFSDGSSRPITGSVLWTSSNTAVATVSNAAASKGVASPVSPGTTQVTATYGAIAGSTVLTITGASFVSIEVTPADPSLHVDYTRPLTATGFLVDGTSNPINDRATWTSSNPTVATVSNAAGSRGVVTGVSPGITEITATYGGIVGSTVLTISGASLTSIEITPINPSAPVGFTQSFTATGVFADGSSSDVTDRAVWTSTVPAIATVSNAVGSKGLATPVATGPTQIFAHVGPAVGGTTTLTVTGATLDSIELTPPNSLVPAGHSKQLTATGHFSDGTTRDLSNRLTWASSNPAFATVSNAAGSRGLVTGVSPGIAQVSAHEGAALGGSTTVTVIP